MIGYTYVVISCVLAAILVMGILLASKCGKLTKDMRQLKSDHWGSFTFGLLLNAAAFWDLFSYNPNWLAATVLAVWIARTVSTISKKISCSVLSDKDFLCTLYFNLFFIVSTTAYVIFCR